MQVFPSVTDDRALGAQERHSRPCSIVSSIYGQQASLFSHESIGTGTHDGHQPIRSSRWESRSCSMLYEKSRDDWIRPRQENSDHRVQRLEMERIGR